MNFKYKKFWKNARYKISPSQNVWGDYRITIHPYSKSKTHSRGGLFTHGGDNRGSAGCIDLTKNISQFYVSLN